MAKINPISIVISLQTIAEKIVSMKSMVIGTGAAAIAMQEVADATELVPYGYVSTDEEYKMADAWFAQDPRPDYLTVMRKIDTDTYTVALDAVKAAGNDSKFYGLLTTDRTKAVQNEVATWAEANKKFFMGASSDTTIGDARTGNYEMYFLHKTPGDYPDARLMGMIWPKPPGSYTMAFKKPVGITDSGLTTTEKNNAETANVNHFSSFEGSVVSYPGKVSSGEWADVIIDKDWIEWTLRAKVARLLLMYDKLPMDNTGAALLAGALRETFQSAAINKMIATVDTEDDQTRSDNGKYQYIAKTRVPTATERTNRIYPVEGSMRISGAIHQPDFNIVITA